MSKILRLRSTLKCSITVHFPPRTAWRPWALRSTFQTSRVDRSSVLSSPLNQSREPDVKVYAGNGDSARKYGLANMASFGQPSSIVAEGNSLIVCDTGVNAITLVSSMRPLYSATHNLAACMMLSECIGPTSILRRVMHFMQLKTACNSTESANPMSGSCLSSHLIRV